MTKAKGRIRGSHNGSYTVRRSPEEAERLMLENLNLVPWTIRRMGMIPDEDKMQDGSVGLWLACLAYDDTTGNRFFNYAVSAITNVLRHKWKVEHRNVTPVVSLEDNLFPEDAGMKNTSAVVGGIVEDKRQTQALLDTETRVYMEQAFSERDGYILRRRMDDATYSEIGKEIDRTGEWVRLRVKSLRDKAKNDLKG